MVRQLLFAVMAVSLVACGGENSVRTSAPPPAQPTAPGVGSPGGGENRPDNGPPGRPGPPKDAPGVVLAAGQTLYVPVYSHVYWGPKAKAFDLACTLSIRNVDLSSAITVFAVDYYDTAGSLVRSHLDAPLVLGPLQTVDYYIEERDTTGGSGANFIVRWRSDRAVNVPVVETVMIGVYSSQGISFICPARAISE